ncbi:MAG TPA: AAA domain-containing protein [Acidimicrobiales bacterium]|nr:AAA domain-containing protein [Acidimicrobiales bacterium]
MTARVAPSPYDAAVLAAAQAVEDAIRADLFARIGRQAAVVAAAPAGAGKSQLVSETAGLLRQRDLRVAVTAPTNEQAYSLVGRLIRLNPGLAVSFVHAQGRDLPPALAALPGVSQPSAAAAQAQGDPLVVATVDKLTDAYLRDGLGAFDVLILDEAFQADAARYYTAAHVAATHLLVGDAGQLDPFSPLPDATFWRGGPEDPLQTAVGVVLRNHPTTPVHRLPITRRLDPRAVPVARCFYPGHHFDSAITAGVREIRLTRPGPGSRALAPIDRALDEAAASGWAHVLLPGAPVLTADPTSAELIRDLLLRLFARQARVRCEDRPNPTDLRLSEVAVGVSHNDQKDLLRALLDDAGLGGVAVDTANRLQGLTYEVVIAWHPLAGSTVTDAFHLDPGRLCVLLTRHRQACIVVGRDTDQTLLDGVPPATPGFLGWDPDPVLDGWDAHEGVFRLLDPHVVHA